MALNSNVPVALLAAANSYQDRVRKAHLHQEQELLRKIFSASSPQTECHVLSENPDNGVFFFDMLRKNAFNQQVQMLHLSGYSRGEFLHFEGGLGEESVKPSELSRRLAKLTGLKLVFLSGCATPELLESLLKLNIPAVLVSRSPSRQRITTQIARDFYLGLGRGLSIKESFDRLKEAYGRRFSYYQVHYDLDQDAMRWEGKKANHLQWGLYSLKDNEAALNWRLPPPHHPVVEKELVNGNDRSRKIKLAGSGILATIFLGLLLVLMQSQTGFRSFSWSGLFSGGLDNYPWNGHCEFPDTSSYNVLLLPFNPQENCNPREADPFYTHAIWSRIKRIKAESDGLDARLLKLKEPICLFQEGQAKEDHRALGTMIKDCSADLIIGGNYYISPNETVNMDFHFMYEGLPQMATLDKLSAQFSPEMLKADGDKFSSAVDDIIYWAQGMSCFKQGKYKESIAHLLKMRERPAKGYVVVDMRLAQCYENLGQEAKQNNAHALAMDYFQKAIARLNHAIEIEPQNSAAFNTRANNYFFMEEYGKAHEDFSTAIRRNPEYAEAYYNRSILYLHLEEYDKAVQNLNRAISLRPDNKDYHGALAVAYAELKEAEKFYPQFELALQKGFDIDNIPSAFSAYRKQRRFQDLLAKYN